MQGSINDFLKPRVVKVQPVSPRQARIVIEPFERGFGHTLGNALRRVLLSSIPGAAITEIEIEGVLHEYTAIEGVQEDVVDILLNLKAVAIRMHTRDVAEVRLHKKGPGPVTAGDIAGDHDIEILNPELRDREFDQGRRAVDVAQGRARPRLPAGSAAHGVRGADPRHRPAAARCLVQPGAQGDVQRRECARRTAHRSRQADSRHRDQRHHRSGRGDSPRRRHPQGSAVGFRRSAGPGRGDHQGDGNSVRSRSCCVRWTSSSSRCAARTA